MKIKEILNVTRGKMLFGNEELEVENFSKDTIMKITGLKKEEIEQLK